MEKVLKSPAASTGVAPPIICAIQVIIYWPVLHWSVAQHFSLPCRNWQNTARLTINDSVSHLNTIMVLLGLESNLVVEQVYVRRISFPYAWSGALAADPQVY